MRYLPSKSKVPDLFDIAGERHQLWGESPWVRKRLAQAGRSFLFPRVLWEYWQCLGSTWRYSRFGGRWAKLYTPGWEGRQGPGTCSFCCFQFWYRKSSIPSILQNNMGFGRMAQQLKALSALRENLGSIPSTYIRWLTAQFQGIQWPLLETHAVTHTYK